MTHDEDGRLAAWLGDSFDAAPVAALEKAFARTRLTRQRPAWAVDLTGGTIAQRPAGSQLRFSLVLAVVALLGLLAGALIVGRVLPPKPVPSPLVNASASPNASAPPTPLAAQGRIVFTRCGATNAFSGSCTRNFIVAANQDGTGERQLFPDGLPTQDVVAMSPDGARIIVWGIVPGNDRKWYLTDLIGSAPRLLDTGCAAPCIGDYGFAFSPDGARLAFDRGYAIHPPPNDTGATKTSIAIMDLATGEVVELESTRNPSATEPTGAPYWSADGQRLLFTQPLGAPRVEKNPTWTTFVVDANGDNRHELVPNELWARDAQWSPDGSLIVFTSAVEMTTGDGSWHRLNDIYTVRPDGTGLSRLTLDTAGPIAAAAGAYGARLPHWTRDGRIVFIRTPSPGSDPKAGFAAPELWVMDANGQNATRLDPADVAKLTAIGCVVCPAPVDPLSASETMAFWAPAS